MNSMICTIGNEDAIHFDQKNVDLSAPEAFAGKITETFNYYNGRKYSIIDNAIAAEVGDISKKAQKAILIAGCLLGGLLIPAAGIGALATSYSWSMTSTALALQVGMSLGLGAALISSFILSPKIGLYDAYHVADMRSRFDINKSKQAFSHIFRYFGPNLNQLRKFFTQKELQYAFDKEFGSQSYFAIKAKVPLEVMKVFMLEASMQEKLKKDLEDFSHSVERELVALTA